MERAAGCGGATVEWRGCHHGMERVPPWNGEGATMEWRGCHCGMERVPLWNGEGGRGGTERVAVAGWRGWQWQNGEGGGSRMERVAVAGWRGWQGP